jgi:hypothetical protein
VRVKASGGGGGHGGTVEEAALAAHLLSAQGTVGQLVQVRSFITSQRLRPFSLMRPSVRTYPKATWEVQEALEWSVLQTLQQYEASACQQPLAHYLSVHLGDQLAEAVRAPPV